jgi:hypothetical protein
MAENRFQKYVQPQQGVVFTDPNAAAEQQREEDRLAMDRERIRLAREAADRAAANDAITREEKAAEKAQADKEAAALEAAQRSQVRETAATMSTVIEKAKEAKRRSNDWFATGFGAETALDWGGSAAADVRELLAPIKANQAFTTLQKMREASPTGGALGAVSERELALLQSTITGLEQSQSDAQFQYAMDEIVQRYTRALAALEDGDRYYRENGSMEGYVGPSDEYLNSYNPDNPEPRGAAGSGATQTSLELPQEYQDRHAAYLRQNWGNITPDGYAQFRAGLDNEFPEYGSPNLEAYRDIVPSFNQMAAEGQPPEAAGQVPAATRELSGFDQFRNNIISDPLGTGVTSAINSATGGLPDLLAGRRLQAAEELNPKAAFVGDLVGSTAGSALFGSGLTVAGAGKFAPFLGDALYGTMYGATSDEDPVTGALLGLGSSIVGDQAGKYAGRAINSIRLPDMNLSEGQRVITQTVREAGNQDEIARALMSADELGVPMTLADASPELQSLAGSAVRFSPTTAGVARQTMARRNEGQFDRLAEAVARDLGPVENIPQRSADLLQQARTNAGPLYEQAYAAPGADMVDLTDLADRPTFEKALREAYNEVLDEGLDPSAAGIVQTEGGMVMASPSWQSLDYAKRGLDNIIERGIRQGDMPEVRRAQAMKSTLLQRMDEANPAYAEARRAYAGPAQERSFMERGRNVFKEDSEQLGVDIANLTPEQIGQTRLGVQSGTMREARKVRNNGNPWGRMDNPEREAIYKNVYASAEDADIARLLSQRDLELQLAGSANRLIGNSATAEREIQDEFFKHRTGMGGDVAMGIVETGALGGPWLTVGKGIADRVFKDRREKAAATANRALADDLGPLLLNQSPTSSVDALSQMMAEDEAYRAIAESLTQQGDMWGRRIGTGAATALTDYLAY